MTRKIVTHSELRRLKCQESLNKKRLKINHKKLKNGKKSQWHLLGTDKHQKYTQQE